jgi:hypothetical protein
MQPKDKIYIAGHRGMVGIGYLARKTAERRIYQPRDQTSAELDLKNQRPRRPSSKRKDPIMFFWLPLKSAVSWPIIFTGANSCTTT